MSKELPHIEFNSSLKEDFGFDVVPISRIREHRSRFDHSPEDPHQLKFYNLIYFTEGSGKHYIDFHWHPVKQNSLLYLAKEQVTAFDFSSDLEGVCLIFTEEYFVQCFSSLADDFVFRLFNPELFSPIIQIPAEADFNDYFSLIEKEFNSEEKFNQRSIIDALFTILVTKAEQIKKEQTYHLEDSSKVKLFQKFSALIEHQITESRSADYFANQLAITYKHLNSICKELLNKTAKQVIDDLVILKAKRHLINSSFKTSEIAYILGFEDPTNFTKYFKKRTGITPKQFISSLKNK